MRALAPLRLRDFRLLWLGKSVALIGDGIFIVAMAWQALAISNSPAALSVVGIAWTLPTLLVLPISGAVSDRVGRRPMMITASLVRCASATLIATLSLSGVIELWQLAILSAVFGLGDALFEPSFTAVVPEIVPEHHLVQANSIDQTMRPLAMQFIGPALGGAVVAVWTVGGAFVVEAGAQLFSVLMLSLLTLPGDRAPWEGGSLVRDLREGLGFVRGQRWLWGSLVAFSLAMIAFWGPYEVLLPFLIKNELDGSAGELGFVLASGGVGAVLAALTIGQRGLPRRRFTFMFAMFGGAIYLISGFGLAQHVWQAALVSMLIGGGFAAGMVVWSTMLQTRVPGDLLGRVSSLDWMVSTSLVPVSFLLVGPISQVLGVRETLILAGLASGTILLSFFLLLRLSRVDDPVSVP
jgi:MFS family permease